MTIPIDRIPPELLGRIFVCANTYDLTLGDYGLKDDFDWKALGASHVCRHWRAVALSTPRMWTEIKVGRRRSPGDRQIPGNIQLVKAYLSRSKEAPLRILACIDRPAAVDSFLLIVSNLHRVLWMNFSISGAMEMEDPFPYTESLQVPPHAPLFQELVITDLLSEDILPVKQRRPVPWFFSACIPSNLKKLQINESRIEWVALPTSLTHFEASYGPMEAAEYPAAMVLKALNNLPLLVHLSLEHVLDTDESPESESLPIIRFPVLQSLFLCTSALACVRFVQHCDFPRASAKLCLYCTLPCTGSQLVPILDPHLTSGPSEGGDFEPITKIYVHTDGFALYRRGHSRELGRWKNDAQLDIVMKRTERFADPFRITDLLHRFAEVTELHVVAIRYDWQWEKEGLNTLLRSLPLEKIVIKHAEYQMVYDVLFPPSEPTFMPTLKHIHLDSLQQDSLIDLGLVPKCNFFVDLYEALARRISAGAQYRVETLVINMCEDVRERDLWDLTEVVHVEWDQYRGSSYRCKHSPKQLSGRKTSIDLF